MSMQAINLGTAPTGVGGDTPRSAFTKTSDNFAELYASLGASGSPLVLPPALPIAKGGTGGTSQGTARVALGLGTAAIAALVGTVAQSGGVATGAVVERGVNGSGSYAKFADGTMICLVTFTNTTALQNGNVGGTFYSDAQPWTYPAQFITEPYCAVSLRPTAGGLMSGLAYAQTVASVAFYAIASAQVAAAQYIWRGIAIGRWY